MYVLYITLFVYKKIRKKIKSKGFPPLPDPTIHLSDQSNQLFLQP